MTATSGLASSDLIARARAGQAEALEAIYVEHGDALMRLAYHLTGSAADAEDVLHDVFLGLPEALTRYQERGAFSAWLRRVATRVALDRLRTSRRRRELPLEDVGEPVARGSVDDVAQGADLDWAMAKLPVSLRTVFVLKEIEGLTHAEIGETLGIRAGTSEVRLHRAIKRLRRYLKGDA